MNVSMDGFRSALEARYSSKHPTPSMSHSPRLKGDLHFDDNVGRKITPWAGCFTEYFTVLPAGREVQLPQDSVPLIG